MRTLIPCPACGRERPLIIQSSPSDLARSKAALCRPCAQTRGAQTRFQALLEDIAWIDDSPEETARRLHTTTSAIARRLQRYGMPEEARKYQNASDRDYKQRVAA
jgi:hypothetical protein